MIVKYIVFWACGVDVEKCVVPELEGRLLGRQIVDGKEMPGGVVREEAAGEVVGLELQVRRP